MKTSPCCALLVALLMAAAIPAGAIPTIRLTATRLAVLADPNQPSTPPALRETEIAAKALAVELQTVSLSDPSGLAEAFAEYLHETVRREWYAPGEQLSGEELRRERYRGIRPAFGYPACPDHSEKHKLFELLDAERVGLELTESFAMMPAAAVSGIYLAHPRARYFSVGRVGRDQVEDYAIRKGTSLEEAERWLDNTATDTETPESVVLEEEQRRQLEEAISALPNLQRTVVQLKRQGAKGKEIAKQRMRPR